VFVLVAHELSGLLQARREGLSKNVSRVVIRVSMLVLLVVYAIFAYSYFPLELGEGGIQKIGMPTVPWGYLVIGALLTVLAALEAVGLVRARHKGLTRNVSRLVSHTVSFLVLLAMLGLAVRKWDHYMERFDITILEGPPGSAEVLERRARSLETAAEPEAAGEGAKEGSGASGGVDAEPDPAATETEDGDSSS